MSPSETKAGEATGSAEGPQDASSRLRARRERIVETWVQRMRREIGPAEHEREPILVDTLPAFLTHLAEALSPQHPRSSASEGSTIPSEHGAERARITRYTPGDLLREYQLLRDVLFEELSKDAPLLEHERSIISKSFDRAIAESCTAYFLAYSAIREQFTTTLTHDLRGPLTAAKASAGLILRRVDSPDVPRWAARVIDNLDRADRMIRDLLDASQLRAGESLTLSLAPCELTSLVREAVTHLETEHGDRFQMVEEGPVHGYWSAEALRRAVENLCSNAVKYGSNDHPITLHVRQEYERAIVSVHNHGSYISVEDQETLFQAFRRTQQAKESGKRGWGIGLALVRGVAEAHGGSILVDSLPEQGTSFRLDIPLDARPYQPAKRVT